jgi:hypothetical protein
VSFHLPPEEW